MKKTRLAVLSICSVFALSALPLPALAATPKAKKISAASIRLCETRKGTFAGFNQDLDQYKKNHYVMPSDMSPYKNKTVKMIDGTLQGIPSATGDVTVYKKGKAVKAKRVNYAIVLQRHQGARATAAAKGVDVSTYDARIAKLSAWMSTAQGYIDNSKSSWAAKNAGSVDCNTKEGQTRAKSLISSRSDLFKSMKRDLSNTKKASSDASKAYSAVAKAYKKKK